MRKFIILFVVLALAACASPAPAATEQAVAAPAEPTQTPVVVVQTVVVEATQAPAEAPTAAPVVVTVVVEATQAPVQPVAPTQVPTEAATNGSAPIALDNALGAGVFINMTMSGNAFTFKCFPREITFNITANDQAIKSALFYYRMVDRPDALYPSEWKNAGEMVDNGGGNFSIVFKGEDVHPDLRLDEAWLDFQFIGLNKGGGVVDRSQKIERLVTFTKECQ